MIALIQHQSFIVKLFLMFIFGIILMYMLRRGFNSKGIVLRKKILIAITFFPTVFWLITGSIRTVEVGTVGVKVFAGQVYGEPLSSGVHIVPPSVQIYTLSNQRQSINIESEKLVEGIPSNPVLTKDGVPLQYSVNIPFYIDDSSAQSIIKILGESYADTFVRVDAKSAVQRVFSSYGWYELLSIDKEIIQKKIESELAKILSNDLQKISKERGIEAPKINLLNSQLVLVAPPTTLLEMLLSTRVAEEEKRRALARVEIARVKVEEANLEGRAIGALSKGLGFSTTPNQLANILLAMANRERSEATKTAVNKGEVKMIIPAETSVQIKE
jgi:hypothetical protein